MKKPGLKKQAKVKKTIEIDSTISRFEVPPLQDLVVIGREAPIGIKAMEKAVEFMSQGNYSLIPFNNDKIIEGIIVKNCVLRMVPEKILVDFIKKEVKPGMCSKDTLKLRVEVVIKTKKSYQV